VRKAPSLGHGGAGEDDARTRRRAGGQLLTTLTTYRYDGSRHWFAERGSPGFDKAAFELARSRVIEQLRA
jgi:dienelactone hydrolase